VRQAPQTNIFVVIGDFSDMGWMTQNGLCRSQ
jgi:hypothetical protein